MEQDILSRIQMGYPTFSKGQKKIADYILEHYDKAAFMTAYKLGQMVSTSESTVVRFATELGCEGYASFQKELQEIIRNKLTAVQRMEVADNQIGEQETLKMVMESDLSKIKQTMEEIDVEMFHKAVEVLVNARKIYILGARSSAALAQFMGFYMNLLFKDVCMVGAASTSEVFEQIMRIDEQDVMIALSFPRYSKRTVQAVQYAKSRGSNIVAITDSESSPINQYATHRLTARSDMASFVDSLVAPLSVINALIVAIGMRKKEEVAGTFEHLEHIWDEYEVYEKSEDV